MPTLADIVCSNFNRIRLEHDLSTRELAARAKMPQKNVYSLCHQTHVPKIDTVEALCKTLFVQPQAIVTASLPVNMLMSRRIGKLIDKYKTLTPEQRDHLEAVLESL